MIINGYTPVVRCVCGFWNLVSKPVHCVNCASILWIEKRHKAARPYVVLAKKAKRLRLHKRAKIVGWVAA